MTVDVMDLNIDRIDLEKGYDTSRYNRAKRIYNSRRVTINNVDLSEDENSKKVMTVDAEVEGHYYDDYDVKLKIVNSTLKEFSCTCPDSSSTHYCKHILATCMEVADPHTYSTKEKLEEEKLRQEKIIEERKKEEKRKLEEFYRQKAYNEKYSTALSLIEQYKAPSLGSDIDYSYDANKYFDELKTRDLLHNSNIRGSLNENIHLEPYIDVYNGMKVNFKIGEKSMYILKNLMEFYNAFEQKRVLYYGQKLHFIADKNKFCDSDKKLLDFVLSQVKLLNKQLDKLREYSPYYASYYSTRDITIDADYIDEFLDILKDRSINIKLSYSNSYEQFTFSNQKLEPKVTLKEEGNDLSLSLDLVADSYIRTKNNIYFFNDKEKLIYVIELTSDVSDLFDVFTNKKNILVPEDKKSDFIAYILPKIDKFLVKDYSSEENNNAPEVVIPRLASKVFLDIDDYDNITLKLTFCYLDNEYDALEKYELKANEYRNMVSEKEVLKRLFNDGFEISENGKYFVLKDSDYMYDFLAEKVNSYMEDYEVLITDKFKNKTIKKPKITNIGVRVDNNLLEMDMSNINFDISEVDNILKNYTLKKKYYKLKNGDLLNLTDSSDLELLSNISESLDISFKDMKEGKVKLPVSRSIYLEKILSKTDNLTVEKNSNYSQIIDNIGNKNFESSITIPKEFEKILRPYQKTGVKWLKTLESYSFGGILADDMGLGKTLQIITVLTTYYASNSKDKIPSIIICPSSLVLNWKAEFDKWSPKIKTLIVSGSASTRKALITEYTDYDVIITSYDLLKRDIDAYEEKEFKYIIADEAQYIKNSNTQNASALKSLNGQIKFALTGTPIENSIAELWSIFDYIMPGYLYNYNKFKNKFEVPIIKDEDATALNRLKTLIEPFVLRRIKSDVLTELPDKNITVMKSEMKDEQMKIYMSYFSKIKGEVSSEINENGFEKSKFKILMLLTRLRQICCHPSLFLENYKGSSGKLEQCMDILEEAIDSGHKILLFSQYTSMFEIFEKLLKKKGINYYILTGQTPTHKRVDMVDSFNKDENVKVFLISLKAGGTGLNLTSADVVMHYDPWWNLSSENQATDRAYRIGQKNSVQVYKFITTGSIEEKINKLQEKKARISDDLLATDEKFINTLSKDELMSLFE